MPRTSLSAYTRIRNHFSIRKLFHLTIHRAGPETRPSSRARSLTVAAFTFPLATSPPNILLPPLARCFIEKPQLMPIFVPCSETHYSHRPNVALAFPFWWLCCSTCGRSRLFVRRKPQSSLRHAQVDAFQSHRMFSSDTALLRARARQASRVKSESFFRP